MLGSFRTSCITCGESIHPQANLPGFYSTTEVIDWQTLTQLLLWRNRILQLGLKIKFFQSLPQHGSLSCTFHIRVAYYLWIAAAPPLCLYFPNQLKKKKYLIPLAWRSNLHPSGVCSPVSSGKDSHHQTERCWFIQAASHLALKRFWCVHKPHSATPSAQRCNEAHPRCPSCPHVPAARRYFIQESHKQDRRQGGNSVPLGRCESLHHCCGQSLLLSDDSAQAHIDIQEDFQNCNSFFFIWWCYHRSWCLWNSRTECWWMQQCHGQLHSCAFGFCARVGVHGRQQW